MSTIETTPDLAAAKISRGPDAAGWFWGTGRRKTAIARVRIKSGKGEFKVKSKDLEVFFAEERDRKNIMAVLEKTGTAGKVDVRVGVLGGGFTGLGTSPSRITRFRLRSAVGSGIGTADSSARVYGWPGRV